MAASTFIVDITPLKRKPGTKKRVDIAVPPPEGLVLASAAVQATRLHLDLQLEGVGEEIIADGSISVDWTGPCRRCLEEQPGLTDIDVHEVFQHKPTEGETYPLAENEVDLEQMVRETVLLHLPVAPLCSDDCAGPDPDRFPTVVVADPDPHSGDEQAPPTDPRWAALSEFSFDE